MAGAFVELKDNRREVAQWLRRIAARMGSPGPGLKIMGEIVRTSVIRNFEVGGRPGKWKALRASTLRRKRGGRILVQQGFAGGLMGSIHARVAGERVLIGTNKVYAAVHQFGAKKGSFGTVVAQVRAHTRLGRTVRAHRRRMRIPWGDIPARPFLMVQDEDWREMREALGDYIIRGVA